MDIMQTIINSYALRVLTYMNDFQDKIVCIFPFSSIDVIALRIPVKEMSAEGD